MNDETETNPTPDDGAPENAAETAAEDDDAEDALEGPEGAATTDGDAEADPTARIAELETQVAELEDKWKRAMAETVNVQQRAERAKQDATRYGAANFAKEMLSVADNLQRALAAIDEDARKADDSLDNLWTGVEMTEREMLNAFERLGVKEVPAEGHKLNPHVHDAMMEMDAPSVPVGTIVQVVQTGYMLHDRLLRPAKVIVAKGGPAEAPDEQDTPVEPGAEKPQEQTGAYESSGGAKGGQLDEEL